MAKNDEATRANQSSDKLLRLIELLAEQPNPLRLQEVATLCEMNASTVLRFLTALQKRNYVAQEIDTGRYYLTFKLCALANSISSYNNIRNISQPFLRSVANYFSESCNLAIENDMQVMYVEVVDSVDKTLLTTQRIGNIAPMHCTGVGKLLLSEYEPAQLEQVIAVKKLPRLTEHTLTERADLIAELEQISKLGYAFDNEECEVGARCIAAPIRDYTGRIYAGISVSGPAVRMTDAFIYQRLPFLQDAANQISARMGWGG